MANKNKLWLKEIDIIKALAILLIVFSHLHFFVNIGDYDSILISISRYLALIGLSLFFFISGFALYYNHKKISLKSLASFYRKRAVRIYPLFWLAIISVIIVCFYYYGFLSVLWGYKANFEYFIIEFLGLQGIFYQVNPSVIFWFVGVILLYYLIYPFIILSRSLKKLIFISSILFGIFLLIHLKWSIIHPNFFLYYYPFIMGIILSKLLYDTNLNFKYLISDPDVKFILELCLILIFVIFTCFYFLEPSIKPVYLKTIFIYSTPVLLILPIYYGALISKDKIGKSYDVISKLSLSTYATFLFHSLILFVIVALLNKLQIGTMYSNFIIILIGLPLVFLVGYYIQKSENKLRSRLR